MHTDTASCVFCKIITKQLPAQVVLETNHALVIKDRAPKAAIHLLVIPKKHYKDLTTAIQDDLKTVSYLMEAVIEVTQEVPGVSAYRFIINNGAAAGQSVFHLHAHILAGPQLPSFE